MSGEAYVSYAESEKMAAMRIHIMRDVARLATGWADIHEDDMSRYPPALLAAYEKGSPRWNRFYNQRFDTWAPRVLAEKIDRIEMWRGRAALNTRRHDEAVCALEARLGRRFDPDEVAG